MTRLPPRPRSFWRRPANTAWLAVVALLIAGQRLLAAYPAWTERVMSRHVFIWLAHPLATAASKLPVSLTELVVVLGPLCLLLALVACLIRHRGRSKKQAAGSAYRWLAWLATASLALFMLLHGVNYARLPLADTFGLSVQKRSVDDLAALTSDLLDEANRLRAGCLEDEAGLFRLRLGLDQTLKTISASTRSAADDHPLLAGPDVRPKGVYLSRAWSHTGIAGLYMPLWVEANVNVAMPEHDIPDTALHEIAHTRGFAREDEANFLAFLAGRYSDNPDVVYSTTLGALVRSLNAMAQADRQRYETLAAGLSDGVRRDLAETARYWRQFEGPVRETATRVNHAYLQANLQTEGVRSYGQVLDLLLAWHAGQREAAHG